MDRRFAKQSQSVPVTLQDGADDGLIQVIAHVGDFLMTKGVSHWPFNLGGNSITSWAY